MCGIQLSYSAIISAILYRDSHTCEYYILFENNRVSIVSYTI